MYKQNQFRYQEAQKKQESPLAFNKIKQMSANAQIQMPATQDMSQFSQSQSRSNSSQDSSLRSSRSWYVSSSSEEYQLGQIGQTQQVNQAALQPQYCISPKHQNSNSVVIKNIPQNYNHILDGFLFSEDDIYSSKTSSMSSHLRSNSEDSNLQFSGKRKKNFTQSSDDSESSYSDFSNASIQKSFKKSTAKKVVGSQASTSSGGFQITVEKQCPPITENASVIQSPIKSQSPQKIDKQTQEEVKQNSSQAEEQHISTIYTVLSSDSSYKLSQIQESDSKGQQAEPSFTSIDGQKLYFQSEPSESIKNKSMKSQEIKAKSVIESNTYNQISQVCIQNTNQTTSATLITQELQETSANKSQIIQVNFNIQEVQIAENKENDINQNKTAGQYFDCRPSLMYCSQCQSVVHIQLYQETQTAFKSSLMQIICGILCCFSDKLNQAVYRCTQCKKLLATVPRSC